MTDVPRPAFYRLIDKQPVPSGDGPGFQTLWQIQVGPFWVSTVFLGVDLNFRQPSRAPSLFETMVFDGSGAQGACQLRCGTWAEAEAQHQRAIEIAHGIAKVGRPVAAVFRTLFDASRPPTDD
jgi:hypothetical protein